MSTCQTGVTNNNGYPVNAGYPLFFRRRDGPLLGCLAPAEPRHFASVRGIFSAVDRSGRGLPEDMTGDNSF